MEDSIYQSILIGDSDAAIAGVVQALEQGVDPVRILNEQMSAAMVEVGRLYENQEYFIPEMMISARAMQKALVVIKPKLIEENVNPLGKYLIGTVKGDLHDIGKNLVAIMLEGVGFDVYDLGTDVSPEEFVSAAIEYAPDIVGMSALLTTTMPYLDATIKAFAKAGLRKNMGVMVGGAPVNETYAAAIGADLFAADAAMAAKTAKFYIQSR